MLEKIFVVLAIICMLLVVLLLFPKVSEIYGFRNVDRHCCGSLDTKTQQQCKEKEMEEEEKRNWKTSRNKLFVSSSWFENNDNIS